jgi:hypothetical protein
VIPRYPELDGAHRGPGIFSLLGVVDTDAVTEERMNQIAAEVQQYLMAIRTQ